MSRRSASAAGTQASGAQEGARQSTATASASASGFGASGAQAGASASQGGAQSGASDGRDAEGGQQSEGGFRGASAAAGEEGAEEQGGARTEVRHRGDWQGCSPLPSLISPELSGPYLARLSRTTCSDLPVSSPSPLQRDLRFFFLICWLGGGGIARGDVPTLEESGGRGFRVKGLGFWVLERMLEKQDKGRQADLLCCGSPFPPLSKADFLACASSCCGAFWGGRGGGVRR